MAFVLIWDCCILCDSVCSGPADYVNLMGEGRRYHNCSVPTNALGCDIVVSYCGCVVGWLEKYVLWRVQQSWRRWLANGYRPCSDISTSFDHSLILNFGGQFLLPKSVSSVWIILCILYFSIFMASMAEFAFQFKYLSSNRIISGKKHCIKRYCLFWLLHVQERRE